MKKTLAIMLALIMVLAMVPALAETFETTGILLNPDPSSIPEITPDQSEPTWNLDISKSKSATGLDANDQSKVTLSIPSAQETLASDVVFVLDKSTSTVLEEQALKLLTDLKKEVEAKKANVKVGVVIFNKIANVTAELTNLDATGYSKIEAAIKAEIKSGTNTHAGLLAGKKMLDDDNTVAPNRKYLIFVSDGVTYQFCKDNYTMAYTRSFDGKLHEDGINQCGTLSELNTQYGVNVAEKGIPKDDINNWIADITKRIGTENDKSEWDYEYTGNAPTDNSKLLSSKENVSNVEKALYLTQNVYDSIKKAGYKCYSVLAKETYPWGTAFMKRLAGGSTVDFASIGNDILYAVGAGSTVEDKMGSDFDLVQGTFELTVGGKPLTSKTEGNVIYFGNDDNLSETSCRFKIVYDSNEDKFIWTINENVSNFAPVQLTYKVKLVNKSTVPGTYTPPTNDYAKLTPKSSDGKEGNVQEFNKPTVSYTISGGGHYHPDPTPVPPIIVNPPKTGDMTIWQSILHFLGIR